MVPIFSAHNNARNHVDSAGIIVQFFRIGNATPAGLDESDRGGFQSAQGFTHHFRANRSAQGFSRISIQYKRHGRDYNGRAQTVDCLLELWVFQQLYCYKSGKVEHQEMIFISSAKQASLDIIDNTARRFNLSPQIGGVYNIQAKALE